MGCGHRRRLEISYTIEDLDLLAPEQRQQRIESRKYKSFLSPDDALRDLRKHASQGAEIRWEMHTSRTDVDLAARARCNCHGRGATAGSLTPGSERRTGHERGDLRKHHSAEGDKWSLKPDTEFDLRKHLSDDSRMAEQREPKWTLQVPEVHANPKQRCTCPKLPRTLSLTPSPSPSGSDSSRRPSPMLVRSLTPELPPMRRRGESMRRKAKDRGSTSPVRPQPTVVEEPAVPAQKQPSIEQTKKMSKKERAQLGEAKRAIRSKWAVKPHLSLPAVERKESRWIDTVKSKSLKERHKYSVRRSMSPEPDQILRGDNRVVRRLISTEVQLPPRDVKWAPYEGYSPLPAVGIKKRDSKKVVQDIKWVPPRPNESPIRTRPKLAELRVSDEPEEEEVADGPEDFHKITPPHLPPPEATPAHLTEDEQFRMRMLNQVSCFPIYQGAWREESPPPTPPPPDLSTPVWSPHDASTVTVAQLRKQSIALSLARHSPSPQASATPPDSPPQPQRKRSTLRVVRASRKKDKAARAKSQDSTRHDQRKQSQAEILAAARPRSILSRGSSEAAGPGMEGKRRPLLRSKAFTLEVPHGELSKRSLSEEVRSYNPRTESTRRGLFTRAKSEDASRSRRPWSPDEDDEGELREYVTTV